MSPPNTITTCFLVISFLTELSMFDLSICGKSKRRKPVCLKFPTCAGSGRSVLCSAWALFLHDRDVGQTAWRDAMLRKRPGRRREAHQLWLPAGPQEKLAVNLRPS